jgi:PKD repeat protein
MPEEPLSGRERVRRPGVLVFIALFSVGVEFSVAAIDFYVSPTGTASTAVGTGTITNPWALQTALSQPAAVHPGDTIWLRGGTYTGIFTSYLTGTASLPIVVRQYPRERATLDGNVNPATLGSNLYTLIITGNYTWFIGLEVTNSNTNRYNPTSGSNPTDARNEGVSVLAQGGKIINCLIHDTGQGIAAQSSSGDTEIYGNLIYYNGWDAPDRGHGHGIYTQNLPGHSKLIKHNFLFDSTFGYAMQAYGSSSAAFVNSTVTENVWSRGPVLVGGLTAFDIGGTNITNNFSWEATAAVGYWSQLCNPTSATGNYFTDMGYSSAFTPPLDPLGRVGLTVSGNTIVGDLDGFSQSDYPSNTYYSKTSPPKANKVVVLPNAYEAGRATIIVYNWGGSSSQAVDLTGVVSSGAPYEIRNAQNFYGPLVASGTYSGGSITLPMTGLTPATPVGFVAPPPTGPAFNTFVVLSGTLGPPTTPNASFAYSPVAPTANVPVTFTDTSNGSPTTWQWNFGDGTTSTQRNPTHTYAGEGTYTVTLTAANGAGSNQTVRSLGVTLQSIPPTPSGFYTLSPCRVIDTRKPNGPTGGPILAANAVRIFPVAGSCGIPADARAVSANLTVAGSSAQGAIRVYPTDIGIPVSSAISFRAGQARSNIAMTTLATDGTGTIGVKNDAPGTVHLILDVSGYFK